MKTKTNYEWDREAVEGHGEDADIHDHFHCDALREVPSHEDVIAMVKEANNSRLVLIRDVFEEDGDLLDRQWAYIGEGGAEPGELPKEFDGGAKVPKRFHTELAKA